MNTRRQGTCWPIDQIWNFEINSRNFDDDLILRKLLKNENDVAELALVF